MLKINILSTLRYININFFINLKSNYNNIILEVDTTHKCILKFMEEYSVFFSFVHIDGCILKL